MLSEWHLGQQFVFAPLVELDLEAHADFLLQGSPGETDVPSSFFSISNWQAFQLVRRQL